MKIRRKKIRKYFKYEKIEYIKRFCRQKNIFNNLKTSKNETVLTKKKIKTRNFKNSFIYLKGSDRQNSNRKRTDRHRNSKNIF